MAKPSPKSHSATPSIPRPPILTVWPVNSCVPSRSRCWARAAGSRPSWSTTSCAPQQQGRRDRAGRHRPQAPERDEAPHRQGHRPVGAKGWKVIASPDRRAMLKGSDYIVNCIEVSGLECVRHDNDIPAKYGVTSASVTPLGLEACSRLCAPSGVARCPARRRGALPGGHCVELHEPHEHALPRRAAHLRHVGGRSLPFRAGNQSPPLEAGRVP